MSVPLRRSVESSCFQLALFSPDNSRFAALVYTVIPGRSARVPDRSCQIEVYDVAVGLLGTIAMEEIFCFFDPCFSPDSRLLLFRDTPPRTSYPWVSRGVKVCLLPSVEEVRARHGSGGSLPVSYHLSGEMVYSLSFFNEGRNNGASRCGIYTVRLGLDSETNLVTCKIRRNPNGVRFEAKDSIVSRDFKPSFWYTCFSRSGKDIIATRGPRARQLSILDRNTGASVTKNVNFDISCLNFSPNGKFLVCMYEARTSQGVAVIDCDLDRIENFGQPRMISSTVGRTYAGIVSFSPNNPAVIAAVYFAARGAPGEDIAPKLVIDLRDGRIVSESRGWNDGVWNRFLTTP